MRKLPLLFIYSWLVPLFLNAQFELEKLPPSINSDEFDEICPVISSEQDLLFFTRVGHPTFNRTLIYNHEDLSMTLDKNSYDTFLRKIYSEIAEHPVIKPISSRYNQDIWYSDLENLSEPAHHPPYPVNNALPNSICSQYQNNNEFVLVNQFSKEGSLYKGFSKFYFTNDSFSFPESIHIYDFYSKGTDINLSMSWDGDVIIISANRNDSYGGNDLYVCFKVKQNLWSAPQNMGSDINSPCREVTPYISLDKRRLFFASNCNKTGNLDIFVSRRLDYSWKKWSSPKRLLFPINSSSDDSQPFIDEINNDLYFTSKRDGSSDIFRINLTPPKQFSKPITITGTIYNSHTLKPISGEVKFGPIYKDPTLNFYRTKTGTFTLKIKDYDFYSFFPQKRGFLGTDLILDPNILYLLEKPYYEIQLYLTPIDKEKSIILKNIYFEKSTPIVLPESYSELNKLISTMNGNINLIIEIIGHTDNVGDVDELKELSLNRSISIKKYLVQNGVASSRIYTKGYGDTVPLNDNSTEEFRRQNRRVEIKILRK